MGGTGRNETMIVLRFRNLETGEAEFDHSITRQRFEEIFRGSVIYDIVIDSIPEQMEADEAAIIDIPTAIEPGILQKLLDILAGTRTFRRDEPDLPDIKTAIDYLMIKDFNRLHPIFGISLFNFGRNVNLMPYQIPHVESVLRLLTQSDNTKTPSHFFVDTSQTGAGKTITTIAICKILGLSPFVICPKTILGNWQRTCKMFGVEPAEIMTIEKLRGMKQKFNHPYLRSSDTDFFGVRSVPSPEVTDHFLDLVTRGIMLIVDECDSVKNRSYQNRCISEMAKAVHYSEISKLALIAYIPADDNAMFKNLVYASGFVNMDEFSIFGHNVIEGIDPAVLGEIERFERRLRNMGFGAEIGNEASKRLTDDFLEFSKNLMSGMQADIEVFWITTLQAGGFHDRAAFERFVERITKPRDTFNQRDLFRRFSFSMTVDQRAYEIFNGFYILGKYENDLLVESAERLERLLRIRTKGDMPEVLKQFKNIEIAKIPTVFRLINAELQENPNRKVIVFLTYHDSMNLLELYMDVLKIEQDIDFRIVNSKVSANERSRIFSRFQQPDTSLRVLITSIRVGGVGLDLDDQHGGFPRTSLIVPGFAMIKCVQAQGRTLRAKTKSLPKTIYVYSKYPTDFNIYHKMIMKSRMGRGFQAEGTFTIFPGDLDEIYEQPEEKLYDPDEMNEEFIEFMKNLEIVEEVSEAESEVDAPSEVESDSE